MTKKPYSQILDRVARDGLTANTDLTPQILARIQKGKSATMQPRLKVLATAFVLLIIFALVLVSVPSVRAAIQRLIGYVPGMGLVGEGQIRTLAEPVSITRDGITLTVEQMWIDSDRTFIQYSVDGRTPDMIDANSQDHGCLDPASLRLPDKKLMIAQPQAVVNWASGYELKSIYPAIPPTVDEVTLVMPCVLLSLPGKAPENWELPLHLIPAPPETVFPVIEISTPVEATPTVPVQAQTNSALITEGISLELDRAVQMDDGYLIYVTIHWENSGLDWIDIPDSTMLHLLDANGQEIAYELDWDATSEVQTTFVPGQTGFAIKTAPIQVPGPLTFILNSVSASMATDVSFTFDPGPDPKLGQSWDLNLDLEVGHGHSVRVLKVTYDLTDGLQAYLRFDMESETGITYATVFDKAHPPTGGGGGGGGGISIPGPFTSDLYYQEPLPKGPITVSIIGISVHLAGRWQAAWTPPQTQTVPSPQFSACLNRESWQQALQTNASLPAGLNGTLALVDVPPPDHYYQVSIAKLDGTVRSIGFGSTPSLSPDGTRVVYMGPSMARPADGLYITDLASGNTALLPGTTTGDMNPLWSPDGQRIAFTRGPSSGLIGAPGPYSIILINIDGSTVRQLTDANDVNYAAAWMPDGNRLLYTVPTRDGVSLNIMDIQTGQSGFLFDINYNGTVTVSPDGKRVAFEEMLPLDKYGLFVSDLDGSNRKFLADGDPYVVTVPAWSPDGSWVVASVHDPDTSKQSNPVLTLIGVDTCQIIPLSNFGGYVSSWLP